jgi:uncharacterized protein (TIGR00725 family)
MVATVSLAYAPAVLYVGVIGASARSAPPQHVLDDAVAAGRLLAQAKAVVVCGGLGGVMEAVSCGVRERGGTSVGLLPGSLRSDGNSSLTLALPTGLGDARNALIVSASDALLAIGRGLGTLSEIALALGAGKPVVGLHTWDAPSGSTGMESAGDAGSAVERVLELAREVGARD